MSAYVVLSRFTGEGRKDIKETVRRAAEVRKLNEDRGFKVIGHYWTLGRFDLVTIVDAPDEEAVMAGLFSIAAAGNVQSETLRAFSDDEMARILAQA